MASNPFQRFGSKVWWGNDQQNHYPLGVVNRIGNGSPNSHKSQDSGFSDSEVSVLPKNKWNKKYLQNDLYKEVEKTMEKTNEGKDAIEKCSGKKLFEVDPQTEKNILLNVVEKSTEKQSVSETLHEANSNVNKKSNSKCTNIIKLFIAQDTTKKKNVRDRFESSSEEENDHVLPSSSEGSRPPMKVTDESKSLDLFTSDVKYIRKLPEDEPDSSDDESDDEEEENPLGESSTDGSLSHEEEELFALHEGHSNVHYLQEEDKLFSKMFEQRFDVEDDNSESDDMKSVEILFGKISFAPCTSTPKSNIRNLPYFQEVNNEQYNIFQTLDASGFSDELSLRYWVKELQNLCEPECTTTLQSKSIASQLESNVSESAQNMIKKFSELKCKASAIHKKFDQFCINIKKTSIKDIISFVQRMTPKVYDFGMEYIMKIRGSANLSNPEEDVYEILRCTQILCIANYRNAVQDENAEEAQEEFRSLRRMLYQMERAILKREVKELLKALNKDSSDLAVRSILYTLTSIAGRLSGVQEMMSEVDGPKTLLLLVTDLRGSTVRAMTLRVLSMISCLSSVVKQLEEGGVIEILENILKDSSRPEPEISEAITLLAQITSPWVYIGNIQERIRDKIDSLISSITDFLEKTCCCNNLLLCAAALVNLSQLEVNILDPLIKHMTVSKLLDAVRRRGPKTSVFLKEQATTLISNLAEHEEFRNHLAEINGALALLYFMQVYPYDMHDPVKRSAAQTVQQKAAVALFRLCSDAYVSQQIVDLGGVHRLIQLCKDGRERQNSDTVLVACLSALRKIVANCGEDVMDHYDVAELIQPRLFESFVIYSTQNESYV